MNRKPIKINRIGFFTICCSFRSKFLFLNETLTVAGMKEHALFSCSCSVLVLRDKYFFRSRSVLVLDIEQNFCSCSVLVRGQEQEHDCSRRNVRVFEFNDARFRTEATFCIL